MVGNTGRLPDWVAEPCVSAVVGSPNPVIHKVMASFGVAGVEAPGKSVTGPTKELLPWVATACLPPQRKNEGVADCKVEENGLLLTPLLLITTATGPSLLSSGESTLI